MEWTADALIISVRSHGESAAIINVFSKDIGRFSGLVRGGNSRRLRAILQPGNMVRARWRARLAEHLGTITLEPHTAYAAFAFDDPLQLSALLSLCALLHNMPDRQAYPRLFEAAYLLITKLQKIDIWPALYTRFELALLEESGFGLDLSSCAATGETNNLAYVSPRSGRAVSVDAAQPYLDKLFKLPNFLLSHEPMPPLPDICDALALIGHFLGQRIYQPLHKDLPEARMRFLDHFTAFAMRGQNAS